MSGISLSPETMSGPFYVTSEKSKPKALQADQPVTGSAYFQGPIQMGIDSTYDAVEATVMIGNLSNNQTDTPDNALYVRGNITHEGDYDHTGDMTHKGNSTHDGDFNVSKSISAGGNVTASEVSAGGITLTSRKSFDILHPTKEGWRLRHVCLEGPSNDVYVRGRITNKTEIKLPEYWLGLVDQLSITVSLTPVGAHQDVIVKRISENTIYLQSKGGMSIDCFYHIYGERKDGEKLIVEYQGQTPQDYPGNNDQYSVAGFHYDQRS